MCIEKTSGQYSSGLKRIPWQFKISASAPTALDLIPLHNGLKKAGLAHRILLFSMHSHLS